MSSTTAGVAWTVRPGRPTDTAAILDLFRATFGKPASEAWYRWKLLESPVPVAAPTTFVATVEDRVVGHVGGTPVRVWLRGHELRAFHACDFMVAAQLRGQGILTAMGRAASDAWATGGASLVLAAPTFGLGLRQRLDYRPMFRLGLMWRPLRLPAAPRPRRRAVRDVEVSGVQAPGDEFDALWETLKGRHEALIVRDRAWVTQRYVAVPGLDYRILLARAEDRPTGYLVYRLMRTGARRSAWIADLFTAPEHRRVRAALLHAACVELRRVRAAAVRIFVARGVPLSRELGRAGFLPRRGALDVSVGPLARDLPWDVLGDPNRLFVMGGDFDVV